MYHKKFDAHCISFVSAQCLGTGKFLGEEAFGLIKTVTRLERTNPSVVIDRMDDYQAIHHKISNEQGISFVCTQ